MSLSLNSEPESHHKDCNEVRHSLGENFTSGEFDIQIDGDPSGQQPLKVHCDPDGWTVIQSRGQFGNPVDHFYRGWDEYLNGFGNPGQTRTRTIRNFFHSLFHVTIGEESWLGLEGIHGLTRQKTYLLRVL